MNSCTHMHNKHKRAQLLTLTGCMRPNLKLRRTLKTRLAETPCEHYVLDDLRQDASHSPHPPHQLLGAALMVRTKRMANLSVGAEVIPPARLKRSGRTARRDPGTSAKTMRTQEPRPRAPLSMLVQIACA